MQLHCVISLILKYSENKFTYRVLSYRIIKSTHNSSQRNVFLTEFFLRIHGFEGPAHQAVNYKSDVQQSVPIVWKKVL